MAQNQSIGETNMSEIYKMYKSNFLTFFAVLAGVVIGVVSSIAMMGSMVRTELADAVQSSTAAALKTAPAASMTTATACMVPSGGSGGGGGGSAPATHTSVAPVPESGGKGGDTPSKPGHDWVHHFVTGSWTNTATISNTGPDSYNVIKQSNTSISTVKNENSVKVVNNNSQTANSGSVQSNDNTTGGSAASGEASNTSRSEYDISITN